MRTFLILGLLTFSSAAMAAPPATTPDSERCEAKPFTLKKPASKPASDVKVASAEPAKAPAPKPKPKSKIEIGCKQPK